MSKLTKEQALDQSLLELSLAFVNPSTTLGTCRDILMKALLAERKAVFMECANEAHVRAVGLSMNHPLMNNYMADMRRWCELQAEGPRAEPGPIGAK